MRVVFLLFTLLPIAFAQAADPPPEAPDEVSVYDLAHYFLSSPGAESRISGSVISEAGANKIKEVSAVHWRDVHTAKELALVLGRLCNDLRSARNGSEFAMALSEGHKRERERTREAARRALAELGPHDRQELENWLNTEFRRGFTQGRIGTQFSESFASAPFPSESTEGITRETCNAATEYEKKAKP